MKTAYAGIDLGGTNIKYGLCRSDGKTIVFRTIPAMVEEGPRNLLERVRACACELLDYATEKSLKVNHLGIGTPGIVDVTTGGIAGMSPNIPGWSGHNPREYLEPKLKLPVYVDNDVNAMALAESVFGTAKGHRNVITATVGTGIGGEIIIDGKLYRGTYGGAGEFGHMTIVKDGLKCNCGRRGCLERYAAAPHLLKMAEKLAHASGGSSVLLPIMEQPSQLTVKDVFDAFHKRSDPAAKRAIELSADYLACGLASVLAALASEIVVIGGGVADAGGSAYIKLIGKMLKTRAFEPCSTKTRVVKAGLGNTAGFIGAAILGDHI